MIDVCFYFQVHQPFRLRRDYNFFKIGQDRVYFDEYLNRDIMQRVATRCYLPANRMMLDLIKQHNMKFRLSYSISGTAVEQFKLYAPEVIDSFQKLVDTGCVELINETYYHSLASCHDEKEFIAQVQKHRDLMKDTFGYEPTAFRNTELIYNNQLAEQVENMGYKVMLTEGANQILGWRTPNFCYMPANCYKLKLLLRNYRLSDDIAFRFSNAGCPEYPITVDKYIGWLKQVAGNGEVVNLFMDYETFGEHQRKETGIFDFMKELPGAILGEDDFAFKTPTEVATTQQAMSKIDVPYDISWADVERDLTAWIGNPLQDSAMEFLGDLKEQVLASKDDGIIESWRKLQTSDHFYYMCTKWFSDGDVHKYFNPYRSPHDAYVVYCNILNDIEESLKLQKG